MHDVVAACSQRAEILLSTTDDGSRSPNGKLALSEILEDRELGNVFRVWKELEYRVIRGARFLLTVEVKEYMMEGVRV